MPGETEKSTHRFFKEKVIQTNPSVRFWTGIWTRLYKSEEKTHPLSSDLALCHNHKLSPLKIQSVKLQKLLSVKTVGKILL
jgi:hypothetical protein